MANDFNSYDTGTAASGPEKPRVFGLKVIEDIDTLRTNGMDVVVTPKKGYLQANVDGSGRVYFTVVRQDGSTIVEAMAGEYFLREALDFDGQTAEKFRVEDAAALPLAADSDGQISRDPTTRRLIKNGPVGGARHFLSEFSLDGLSFRRIECSVASTSTAPNVVRDDADGYLMDDGTDDIRFKAKQPLFHDYSEAHDVFIEALVSLESGESATDTIDMQCDYEKALLGQDSFDGVTTNATDTGVQVSTGNAAGTLHRVLIPLPFNDANNPMEQDALVRGVLTRNGLSTVGAIVVYDVSLLVPCYGGVDFQTS